MEPHAVKWLEVFLRSRLEIRTVERKRFPGNWMTADEVITTNRFLLILRGRMEYEVEGNRTLAKPGTQLFAPNWVRRRWRVPKDKRCEAIWCEFATDFFAPDLGTLFVREPEDFELELATLSRMETRWQASAMKPSTIGALQLEGELKASLARFWPEAIAATPFTTSTVSGRKIHPEVQAALHWLEENYASEDALEAFYTQLTLTPNHFRLLFREATQSTVQEHLARLRLRRARHLLHHTRWPLKQIAAEIGYRDPLFFSRQFRKFWGKAPREEREN